MRRTCFVVCIFCALAVCQAQSKSAIVSLYAEQPPALSSDPGIPFWRDATAIYAEVNGSGHQLPDYRTEVRSRWTKTDVYFLFVCPYKQLSLKPDPHPERETFELWNWNVAEVFIGSDFKDIQRYKEFELSPRNEWVDLDIDLHKPHHENGWLWNSGFEHTTRIDEQKHVWYAALRIPFSALDSRRPAAGKTFRVNFYRTDGAEKNAQEIMWQPVMSNTFHVPEKFGVLKLEAK